MKTKKDLQDEIGQLRSIAFDLHNALKKTPETAASKQAIDNFIKYIMEKL